MLQPSDVRQTFPCGCAVGSAASASGFGARLASTSHGSAAASASSAHAQRHPPACSVGHRYCQQRRQHRAQLQHADVERAHGADLVGEVTLHQRRHHHVADAHAGQRDCRAQQQRADVAGAGAQQQAGHRHQHRQQRRAFQAQAPRQCRRGHAEQRERGGRQHAQHAGHGGTEAELLAEHVQQGRDRRDCGAQVDRCQQDGGESQHAPVQQRRRIGSGGTHRWSLQVSHAAAMACSAGIGLRRSGRWGWGLQVGRQRGHCTCALRQGPVMRAAWRGVQKNPEDSDVFQASW